MRNKNGKTLAIIPARGGSKRIPRKNIKLFQGKPAIFYAIDTAKKSKLFDEIMVSTDDDEIAKISASFGAKVPFVRSKKNSDDDAILSDVISEVLLEYAKIGKTFDYFCCIYPVTPLLNPKFLSKAFKILIKGGFDTVMPIVSFGHPIQRALRFNSNNKLEMIDKNYLNTKTQDLQTTYFDPGQFFFMNTKSFLIKKKIFTDNSQGIVIPALNAQDIDNEEDWRMAEVKYRILHKL